MFFQIRRGLMWGKTYRPSRMILLYVVWYLASKTTNKRAEIRP